MYYWWNYESRKLNSKLAFPWNWNTPMDALIKARRHKLSCINNYMYGLERSQPCYRSIYHQWVKADSRDLSVINTAIQNDIDKAHIPTEARL